MSGAPMTGLETYVAATRAALDPEGRSEHLLLPDIARGLLGRIAAAEKVIEAVGRWRSATIDEACDRVLELSAEWEEYRAVYHAARGSADVGQVGTKSAGLVSDDLPPDSGRKEPR